VPYGGLDRIDARASSGSVENLARLIRGGADFAFSAVDAAAQAYLDRVDRPVRAVARLYDDYIHLVVDRRSPVTSVAGLRGLRVSIGANGSGTELIARRLLEVGGALPDRDVAVQRLGAQDSAAALRAGRIDAFFWSGGLPTPAVAHLAGTTPIRLLDLRAEAVALHEGARAYYRATKLRT
jgi:uncharacterized protein